MEQEFKPKPDDKTPRKQFEDRFGKDCWGFRVGDSYYTNVRPKDDYTFKYTHFYTASESSPMDGETNFSGLVWILNSKKEPIKRLVRVSPAIGITKNGPTVLSPHAVESRHAASTWFNLNGLCVDEIQWPLRSADGSPVWYIREEEVE